MRSRIFTVSLLVLVFSSAPMIASAVTIGFNFNKVANDVFASSAEAGAPGFRQTNWNQFAYNQDWSGASQNDALFAAGIKDSAGNVVSGVGGALLDISYPSGHSDPVHFDAGTTWQSGIGSSTPDHQLMNGYLDDGGNDQPYVNLSLAAGTPPYSVVVYLQGDGTGNLGRYWLEEWTNPLTAGTVITDQIGVAGSSKFSGTYTLVGTYGTTLTPTNVNAPAGDYIIFENVTVQNVRIRAAGNGDPEDYGRGPINAIQIAPASAVPEPSTFALAALGLLGLGWFGWRRRKR